MNLEPISLFVSQALSFGDLIKKILFLYRTPKIMYILKEVLSWAHYKFLKII